jgi:hypothetical protein
VLESVIGATLVVIAFAVLAHYIGLIDWTGEVTRHARKATAVLQNSALDDLAKEKAMQSAAIELFKLLGLLTGGSIIAVALPIAAVWLADAAGVLSFDAVMAMLIRWEFLLAATVIGFAVFFLLRRISK